MGVKSSTKPDAWTLSPQLTEAPELWRGCTDLFPFWESYGKLMNIVSDNHGSPVNDPARSLTTIGGYGVNIQNEVFKRYIQMERPVIPPNGDFSLSFWINIPATADGSGGPEDDIVYSQGDSGSNRIYIYSVTSFGNASKSVRAWSVNLGELVVGSDNRGAGWVNTTITRKWDVYKIYENGVLTDSNTVPGSLGESVEAAIGAGVNTATERERFFEGQIAYFSAYDRALTKAEIVKLANDPFAMLRPAGF